VEPDLERSGAVSNRLESLCSLSDPNRQRLYAYVAASATAVTREEASAALGVDRSVTAYHLDKLVDEGLLEVEFARPEGRTGPGAGRTAKHYRRADRELSVSVPPRDYHLAAELLARAAEADPDGTVRRALDDAARDMGREFVASVPNRRGIVEFLAAAGYEPFDENGALRLRNCPFHRLARRHVELVCGMNLAMLEAVVEALHEPVEPRLDPAPDRCCVAFAATG
jgi:predicted ArsR family transcriptional regulator